MQILWFNISLTSKHDEVHIMIDDGIMTLLCLNNISINKVVLKSLKPIFGYDQFDEIER